MAVVEMRDELSMLSLGFYLFAAYFMYFTEYKYGTDALRFLDNNYYADSHLLPSLFYILGIR